MARPQKENGYTPVANEILEAISKCKLNGTQFRILTTVWRFTYGFNRKQHGISVNFLVEATELSKRQIQKELNSLIEENVLIEVRPASFNKTRIIGFNKDYESWKCFTSTLKKHQMKENSTGELLDTSTGELLDTSTGELLDTQERNIKDNIKYNIYTIFEYWNSKKIMVHKELNQKRKSAINARLKNGYSQESIIQAINNYDQVLKSDECYWTHKWSLEDFMNPKNLDRFLDENNPLENFAKDKNKKNTPIEKSNLNTYEFPAVEGDMDALRRWAEEHCK